MIDPALMLAQLGQGAKEIHAIQTAPELAQGAARDVAAQQLLAEQQQVQDIEKTEPGGELSRKVKDRAQERRRKREERRARRAAAHMETQARPPETGAPDSQTDEVAGLIVDTSV